MAAHSTSSRALLYFSERVEDAAETVKGLLGATGPGGSGGAAKFVDTSDDVVRAQLESDRDEVRLEGLRTVVALISKGRDASGYFASVVKLSSNGNMEIRKLVYIIVRRYARRQPDIALLGINSFQRDLQDRNEVVRAMALRVLTGLRLKLAASVVQLAISKCVRDPSFHVRRAAALALIKSRDIVPGARDTFKGYLSTLLSDRNPAVLSASVVAWSALFPRDFSLLHAHYRKLCFALVDMDGWGQREVLAVLGLYAKRCLPEAIPSNDKMDRDLDLLLLKTEDLLCSPNPAVVTAAARLILSLGPASRHGSVARPMVRLTNGTPADVAFVALLNCLTLARSSPALLLNHIYDFLPRSSLSEPAYATKLKQEVLVCLATADSADVVLSELVEQAKHNPSEQVASSAVEQIGRWAQKCSDEQQRTACIQELLQLVKTCRSRHRVASSALIVIRRMVEGSEAEVAALIVTRLVPLLFTQGGTDKEGQNKRLKLVGRTSVQAGAARASIYWLLGQHCRLPVSIKAAGGGALASTIAQAVSMDVARRAAMHFGREATVAKLQIITLSTKLFTALPTLSDVSPAHIRSITALHAYILQLARYDEDFDVRDRARFCKALTDRFEVGLERPDDDGKEQPKHATNGNKGSSDDEDGEQLGGVVLRRNQVMHILFDGKRPEVGNDEARHASSSTERHAVWNTLIAALGPLHAATLPLRFPDYATELWSDAESRPPANVRDLPAAVPASTNTGSLQAIGSTSTKESGLSTGSTQSGPGEHALSAAMASGGLTPLSATGGQVRYQDLDAFLDEEEIVAAEKAASDASVDDDVYRDDDDMDEEDEEEVESEEDEDDEEVEDESEDESGSDEDQPGPARTPSLVPPAEENAWA